MRILIATGIFKPELGGPATLAVELGKRLSATGHSVTVVTYSDQASYSFDKEFPFRIVRVKRLHNKLLNYLKYFFKVRKEMLRHDVVYSLDWFSAGVPLMLAAKNLGKKYVVRVGGGYIWEKYLMEGKPPVTLKQFYEQGLQKHYRFMFLCIRHVLRQASVVIFNSEIQRELYIKQYDLIPEKTTTIFNAIPENRLSNLVQSYHENPLDRDKEIVFAGRYIKMKNVESLIRAFVDFKDPTFKLILIGEGPQEKILRDLVHELNLSGRVTFLPLMSQAELYRRIAHCYLVVIPSWTDVSPHQAYECLALGIPFLMTKENYLSIHDQIPLMIDPTSVPDITEKLNSLLDEKTYTDFVQAERAISFHHSWSEVISQHLRIFMKLSKNDL